MRKMRPSTTAVNITELEEEQRNIARGRLEVGGVLLADEGTSFWSCDDPALVELSSDSLSSKLSGSSILSRDDVSSLLVSCGGCSGSMNSVSTLQMDASI
eukprot:CAMPEP_0169166818 /NCGR_PEP_ID=MMETSP1015-20121227/60134_1 /TAXON_ID=342587 /ORGANISM="Karlodinium micrum, Strain CCMP2283" /LENGTH=99 /DNA_ID=CAMNT_0009239473 /DNA_START=100 /DNA_END=399 /DNA_ORIENTATION=+